jgi:hypothetical protein
MWPASTGIVGAKRRVGTITLRRRAPQKRIQHRFRIPGRNAGPHHTDFGSMFHRAPAQFRIGLQHVIWPA